ncbi:MAG TPA: hypothetical protein VHG92_10435 [Afifellaceae bacterium]|nr:hypothetical protein [Afifellaceae bacterium]
MLRAAYIVALVTLLGGSAVMAAGIEDRDARLPAGVGLVLLTSLQR